MVKEIKLEENKKTNSKLLRNFILVLLLVVALTILVLAKYKPELFDYIFKEKTTEEPTVETELGKKVIETPVGDNSIFKQELLPSFAPNESEAEEESGCEGSAEETEEAEHPYEQEVKNEEPTSLNAPSSEKSVQMSNLDNYRLFLANANKLLAKLGQDEVMDSELGIFSSLTHPAKITNILILLEEYNKMLSSNKEHVAPDKFVGFFSTKPLNKLVKVTKLHEGSDAQKQLKERINEKLPLLINYIYSPELQESFINNK